MIIGASPAILRTQQFITRIATHDAPVLIEGETGTGKELAARAIHYQSRRRERMFVPVNCGAIPEQLVESELFGHRRGAFTDAKEDSAGLIALANGGTLFLDEIDALPLKGQVALLRFLQDRQYRQVGGKQFLQADVRLIAASNRNLTQLVANGAFRDDLLYRLKLLYLEMPPLRDRAGDATLLARFFMQMGAERFNVAARDFHPDTLTWFERYAWPGNVRELENLVYRELLLGEDGPIAMADAGVREQSERRNSPDRRRVEFDGMSYGEAKARVLADFERRYLLQLVARTGGNVTAAARLAGKERRSFGRLLQKKRYRPRAVCVLICRPGRN
jgi:two-component system response regulator GlrR